MTKKETAKKENIKKATVTKKATGKTDLVLSMVEKGKTRKEILDILCKLDPDISRKSNAGLVSHIFKAHDLLGKVESGSVRGRKKEVKVEAKKVTPKKKTSKKKVA